jgi:hypothetical protein
MYRPYLLSAALIFAQIEYDPEGADNGREWVRITNTSSTAVDLTNWRFVEAGVNHKLTALQSSIVPAGGSAIIADDAAQYISSHPGVSDLVFDSSFSLSNTGEYLALKNASSTVVAEITYSAVPKTKPKPIPKTPTVSALRPRLLNKEQVPVVAAVSTVAPRSASLWPWLIGVVALGFGAGMGLVWVRRKPSPHGYTIVDISRKDE